MTERMVERRIVTVLFADLVGFTSLSERLDAEDVALVQDAYFKSVRETIVRHGGVLEKFVGDAAMAVFGAPRVRDDDAERAVRAGLALVAAVSRLGAEIGLDEGSLQLRVGVNSGEVVYGEATAERGPVTGDPVNIAARLQAAADPGCVLVGELTSLAVADAVELEPAGALELKGKAEPVPAWRALEAFPERSRERALGGLRSPMIGRLDELRHLLAALGGGARRIVVVAPPGVGKTRLLNEYALQAADTGAAVFRARLRPDLLSPFEPIGQLVRSAAEPFEVASSLTALGVPAARAAVVQGALAALVAPVEPGTGLGEERDQLFAAWLQGLDAIAGKQPAVWLIEDLHWASADLLAFLHLAGLAASAHGRLVVGTTRPVLLESAEEWCGDADLLHLAPLPPAETAALVGGLVGDVLPAELVDRIAEASGGNALFVEELLRTWISTGLLTMRDGDRWTLAADAGDVALPPTVQAIYAGQLDDLPPSARTAARRGAVAGRRFPLAGLEPLAVDEPAAAVATLVRRALVSEPSDDPILGPSYVYRHALLRDAGYASLSRGERALLHARYADWLASFPDDVLSTLAEVIGRHYAAAVESAPALSQGVEHRTLGELRAAAADWFERAAEVATQFAAWESARELAQRSVDLTADSQPVLQGRRLELLAQTTANTLGVDQAERLLRRALDVYRAAFAEQPLEARAGLAKAGAALGHLIRAQTRFEEAARLASELLDEVGGPDDPSVARLLLLRSVAVLNAWDDFERADADATRALPLTRGAGDAALELEALQLAVQIRSEQGPVIPGAWVEVERLARESGRWESAANAIRMRAWDLLDDEPDRALPLIFESGEIATAHGLVEAGGWVDYMRAEAHMAAGRWSDAIEAGLRAIELGEERGFHRVVVRSWFVLLPIARAQSRNDLIRQAFPRFDERARLKHEADSYYARIVATATHLHFAGLGLEAEFVPDIPDRLHCFDMDHTGPSWLAGIETVVGSWLAVGELEGVEQALERMRTRLETAPSTSLARATEAILRGRLLLAQGRPEQAVAAAGHALTESAGRAPWWRAKAIRILDHAGAADGSLIDEATSIEMSLGIR
jgi:class 3 adenylate cyclase/tetratricopeptide (TPR) repeat protein